MFGGLEIKGSEPSKPATPARPPASAPPGSGFSFLNSAAPPEPSPPAASDAAASSGFSFLNAGPTQSQDSQDAAPPPGAGSGFSFMATAPAPPPTPAASDAGGTGFSFLQPPATGDAAGPSLIPSPESLPTTSEPSTTATPAASSFSFMGSPGISTGSVASSDATPAIPEPAAAVAAPPAADMLSASLPAPAGSGVVFGGAMASKAKPKKKRNRTTKIGTAANASLPPPSAAPPAQAASASTRAASTRDAAEEASRRAEEFMSQKLKEEAGGRPPASGKPKAVAVATSNANLAIPAGARSLDEDDAVVQAAKAAAEEAQQISAKQHGGRSILSGLWRSSSKGTPGTGPGNGYSSGSSSHGIGGGTAIPGSAAATRHPSDGHAAASSALPSSVAAHVPPVAVATSSAVERLHREQEEAKRSMAERELQMLQQSQSDEKKDPSAEEVADSKMRSSAVPPPAKISSFQPPQTLSITPPASVPSLMKKHPAPTPPVKSIMPLSPTGNLHRLLAEFRVNVVNAMDEVTRLRQHRSGLLEEQFLTSAKHRLATQQLAAAQAEQMQAAEAEDFELADRMQTTIDSHQAELIEFASILENIGRAVQQLDAQKSTQVERLVGCFSDVEKRLARFREEQESQDDSHDTETLRRFSTVSRQLSAENERLQHDWKHLERDADLLEQERQEVEASISEQSGEYEGLLDEAKSNLQTVETEIEELRKVLAEKQKIAADLRTEAAGHEEAILKVRVKFSRQLQRLQTKQSTLSQNKEEWELEKAAHETHKSEHEAKVNAHSEALDARDSLVKKVKEEIGMAGTFTKILADDIGLGSSAGAESGASPDDELAQLQADVVKSEANVREAKDLLKSSQAQLQSLEEEVTALETKIPIFEETKKVCAARRDFKGAGKASKDIKEATARLAQCRDGLIAEAGQAVEAAKALLAEKEKEHQASTKVACEKERESSVSAMHQLAEKIARLVKTKASVCAETKSSDESVQSVGALVLDAQIKALQMEGETYGEKYGLWDELMAGVLDDKAGDCGDATNDTANDATGASEPAAETPKEVTADDTTAPVEDDLETRLDQFRQLTQQLKVVEHSLEKAVVEEDYDQAAVLDEELQKLVAQTASLHLTPEEMVAALPDDAPPETEATEEVNKEEAKVEATDTDAGETEPEKEKPEETAEEVQAEASSDNAPAVEAESEASTPDGETKDE